MNLNETKLNKIFRIITSKNNMLILSLIPKDSAVRYGELKKEFNKIRNVPENDNTFAHHLRALVRLEMVRKKEERVYIISRLGIRCLELIDNFKEICMDYDMSDVDADGKIVLMVKGRRL
uniref:ORF59 n=1 Tax=Nitrosopumilaceae spindle-shaped virus TaxID=3065433 RepID=A0AAT9J7M5_9VIRU